LRYGADPASITPPKSPKGEEVVLKLSEIRESLVKLLAPGAGV
jgi:hypothetical protein